MEYITQSAQTILQILPLGNWLTESIYGIICGVLLFDIPSCLILLLSKFIFKEYFSNSFQKTFFLSCIGGTALLVIGVYLYQMISFVPVFHVGLDGSHFKNMYPVYHTLTLIAYVFFVGYLVDFILRLVHLGKSKCRGKIPAA